jgi:hypothetical protein
MSHQTLMTGPAAGIVGLNGSHDRNHGGSSGWRQLLMAAGKRAPDAEPRNHDGEGQALERERLPLAEGVVCSAFPIAPGEAWSTIDPQLNSRQGLIPNWHPPSRA